MAKSDKKSKKGKKKHKIKKAVGAGYVTTMERHYAHEHLWLMDEIKFLGMTYPAREIELFPAELLAKTFGHQGIFLIQDLAEDLELEAGDFAEIKLPDDDDTVLVYKPLDGSDIFIACPNYWPESSPEMMLFLKHFDIEHYAKKE